jgi:hypothetical protein
MPLTDALFEVRSRADAEHELTRSSSRVRRNAWTLPDAVSGATLVGHRSADLRGHLQGTDRSRISEDDNKGPLCSVLNRAAELSRSSTSGLQSLGGTVHLVNASVLEEWNALTDAEVTAQVLMGRTALFEVLMRRHNERVYRTIRAIVGNDGEAEEVLQQVYVNAYANLRKFDSTTPFAIWLTRMAVKAAATGRGE